MTVRKLDLKKLCCGMTDHKFFRPEMIGQAVPNLLRIGFELFGDGELSSRRGIRQRWMEQVKGYAIAEIFDLQTLRQRLNGSFGRSIGRDVGKTGHADA